MFFRFTPSFQGVDTPGAVRTDLDSLHATSRRNERQGNDCVPQSYKYIDGGEAGPVWEWNKTHPIIHFGRTIL